MKAHFTTKSRAYSKRLSIFIKRDNFKEILMETIVFVIGDPIGFKIKCLKMPKHRFKKKKFLGAKNV